VNHHLHWFQFPFLGTHASNPAQRGRFACASLVKLSVRRFAFVGRRRVVASRSAVDAVALVRGVLRPTTHPTPHSVVRFACASLVKLSVRRFAFVGRRRVVALRSAVAAVALVRGV
jgi:hypothetical protein